MLFRKCVGTLLVVSQVFLGMNFAFADSNPPSAISSPEAALIEGGIALQAENLPQAELQKRFADLMTNYLQTAPAENREARLEQAIVGLHIMSSQQASALGQQVASDMHKGGTDANVELQRLFSSPLAGAQFSYCMAGVSIFMGCWVGALGIAIASKFDNNNQTANAVAVALIIVGFTVGAVGYVSGC